MRCGSELSQGVPLELLSAAATPTPSPVVSCVENVNPRDGWWDLRNSTGPKPVSDLANRPDSPCSADVRWIARMESNLAFQVTGLKEWRESGDNKRVLLHLFINGIEVANLTPRYQGRIDRKAGPMCCGRRSNSSRTRLKPTHAICGHRSNEALPQTGRPPPFHTTCSMV